jgi:S1-C subfamily serine protease
VKKLLLLLFIPIVCFGQEDIDYSSEKSIFNYIEANPSNDLLEGVWDNLSLNVGAVMIRKKSDEKYVVIACAGGFDRGWNVTDGNHPNYNMPGDTIAILEKSFGGEKLFVSLNTNEIVGTKKNKRTVKVIRESTVDYPSLSNPTTIIKPNYDFFMYQQDRKIFDGRYHYYLDSSIETNYGVNNKKPYLTMDIGKGTPLIKIFPKPIFNKETKIKTKIKTGEWAGNGSGIIISKSGYIVTNHHVIEGADDIEVEFIVNDEVQKFNAEIVQSDKVNDLAIIKIFDMNFDGLDNLPYNFKTRSSDVGTKVYAYGYPMALSLMGKEIKITDGIISSKSGFDGDVTSYQISAPIQAGNSGGPLFDDRGNFIGINSAGLRKEVADNVGYTIKSSYVLNLIDVLPKSIDLPSSTKLQSLPLTEQIKEISKYVVLVKVK